MTDKNIKRALSTLSGYEPYHEGIPLSTPSAKDVTANLNSVTASIQDHKYQVILNKPVIWLRIIMKAHNIDYFNGSHLEGIPFTQDETYDLSL